MGGLTSDRPKCMTVLGGRTLLDRQLDALAGAGIADRAIVRGYQGATFAAPVTYFENPRWSETNMVASLACAADWLQAAPCVISYSDIVYGVDSVRRLLACDGDIAITFDPHWRDLWELRFDDPLSDAESFRRAPDGRLLEIGARCARLEDIQGQYMGLLRFSPAGWLQVRALLDDLGPAGVDALDMTSLLRKLLARDVRVDTVPIAEPWYEVDSESDLRLYEEKFFSAEAGS
ncbi:nucleotidyl transferase [bacterium DOLZORAL124_64_63]|nr:MAG: nucleotidyl transferase [bacterium DOLZORAL124_64_63]